MTHRFGAIKQAVCKPFAHLTLIAGLSGLIYLTIFTLRFPLVQLFDTIPPVDYAKLTHHAPADLVIYIIGIGALFWLYIRAVRIAAGDRKLGVGGRFVTLSSAGLAAVSVSVYPLTAIDLFIYAIRTRGWALYGLNPLATAPQTLPQTDPWIQLAAEWVDAPSPYGPVWESLSLGAYHLAGGNYLAHLFGLKIVAILAYLGCVWLVYKILQKLQPDWAVAGAVAFGWSPLVLLESGQNGHNDIVMVLFLLAAVGAWTKWAANHQATAPRVFDPWLWLVCLFLALSILVKFVTTMIVPFFLIGITMTFRQWRQRLLSLVVYGAATGGIVATGMWPFWPGLDNWVVLNTGSTAGRSLMALLVLALRSRLGTNAAFALTGNSILLMFAGLYLYYFVKTIYTLQRAYIFSPAPRPASLAHLRLPLSAAFFVLFWYVLLAAPVFHAWYLLWFVPLAVVLLPHLRPLIVSTVFSLTALLVIPYFETVRVWYPALLQNHLVGHLIGVPLLIAPPLVAMFWPISPPTNSEV